MSLDNPLQSLITLTVTHTCLNGTSCIWFCSHSFLFIHWIPVRIPIWLCVLYSLSHQLFIDIDKIPLNLLLPSLSSLSFLSLLLCNRCSIPWALWPFDGLIPVCQFLFCTGDLRTGHNTPAGSHQCWGAGVPLLTYCWCSSQRLTLLWGPITGSWSPWHLPGHPGSFLPSCFTACCSSTWCTGIFLPMSSLEISL